MRLLLSIVLPLVLGGCWSQIFLDSVPGEETPHIASNAATKRVFVLSSNACERLPSAPRYLIRENAEGAWIQRCVRIQGFDYRPGNEYLLQVTEYPSGHSSVQLVFEKVIAQWPQAGSR